MDCLILSLLFKRMRKLWLEEAAETMCESSLKDHKDIKKIDKDQEKDESSFPDLIYKSPIPFFAKDRKHRYIGASLPFLNYVGLTSEELMGKTDADFAWFSHHDTYRQMEEATLHAGKSFDHFMIKGTFNGENRTIYVTQWPTYAHGHIAGLMGYFFDEDHIPYKESRFPLPKWLEVSAFVDQLKILEKDYRQHDTYFGVIFVSLHDDAQKMSNDLTKQCQDVISKVVNAPASMTCLEMNRFAIALAKHSPEELTKMAEAICDGLEAMNVSDQDFASLSVKTHILYAPDIVEIHERLMRTLFDEHAEMMHYEENAEYNTLLRSIISDLPVGCYVIKPDHTLLYWNKKAEELLGFKAHEMEGKKCTDMPLGCAFTSGMPIPAMSCPAMVAAATGRPYTTQMFMKRVNGKELLMQNTLVPIKDQKGQVLELVSVFIPLVQEDYDAALVNKIYELTTRDALTCLPGRKYMENCIAEAIETYQRTKHPFAILFADMNNFHAINNTYGHDAGDAILRMLALALRKYGRKTDRFCRWGGDEFVGLLQLRDPQEIITAARRLKKISEECCEVVDGKKIYCEAAIGITVVKEDDTIDSLIKRADTYMYQAKKEKKDRIITDYNTDD